MSTELKKTIQNIQTLAPGILEELLQHFQHQEYPKNYLLLKQGKNCEHLWFMTKGAVRYFYTSEEGKETNTWLSLDQQIVTDAPSLIRQDAAQESIQLLEDSEFYVISYRTLQRLLQKHHSLALWYIKLVEQHYVQQIEDRIADLQFLDAKQRYFKLLDQFPDIVRRISLGHIASYLNITQETLSRIRAGKA